MKKIYLSLLVFVLSFGATYTEVPGVEITTDEGSYFITVKSPIKAPVAIVFRQKPGVAHANTIVVQGYKVNAKTGALEDRKAVTLDTISDEYAMRIDTSKPVTYKISAFIPKKTDPQSKNLVDVTECFAIHVVTGLACEKLSYEPLMLKNTVTLWQKKEIRIALAGTIILALAALYFISQKYYAKNHFIKSVTWDRAGEPPKYVVLSGGIIPNACTGGTTNLQSDSVIVLEYNQEKSCYIYPINPIEPRLFLGLNDLIAINQSCLTRTPRRGATELKVNTTAFDAGDITTSNYIDACNAGAYLTNKVRYTKAQFFN